MPTVAAIDALEDRVPPLVGLAVAVVAISTSAILVELSGAPSLVKALYRVVFTTALLLPIAVSRPSDRAAFGDLGRRDLLLAGVSGVALAVHFASWFESLRWTSVAASVTLVQAQPLFVVAGAWAVLDERIGRTTVVGVGVALVGMAAMSVGDTLLGAAPAITGPDPLLGNALAVLGAAAAGAYVLLGRSLRQRLPLLPYVIVVYGTCALALLAATIARGHPLVGYGTDEWLLFLAMAAGPGVFGHTVINWALAHVESSVVSVSLLGEPVGSTILAMVLLAEYPSLVTLVGGAVVLAGVVTTTRARET
ncbi:DMT family transporter [Halobaculum magnesiiphilum]|uniref:DMT family transporter n=1 Tax=Halobaculum magnesiiphilum TaxID=1017351 RepID=UPI001CED2723|nr:DMT family transporter [Halobaculum magnesiiphilum]